jgi:hypothetical protein
MSKVRFMGPMLNDSHFAKNQLVSPIKRFPDCPKLHSKAMPEMVRWLWVIA